jgi:DNA adenine methylase
MPYLGGKSQAGVYQRIINLIPPHDVYLEPFLGGGAIMRLKRPARLSYGVDRSRAALETALPAGASAVHGCGIDFLENFPWRGGEFVYADPPYLLSTRKSRARYEFEMTDAEHSRLLDVLRSLPCPVLLSGYPSALYDEALAGWEREEFQVMTRGHTWATEVLWRNYPRPEVLHDVSFVGSGYRERLRIKRKRARWAARLARMPALERAALFSALVDAMGEAALDPRAVSGAAGLAP